MLCIPRQPDIAVREGLIELVRVRTILEAENSAKQALSENS